MVGAQKGEGPKTRKVAAPKGGGPKMWAARGREGERDPKFRLFSLSGLNFHVLPLGSSRGILVVFLKATLKCARLSCEPDTPRTPNMHISGPGA